MKTQTLYYAQNKSQINKVREEVSYKGKTLQSIMVTHFTPLRSMISYEDQTTEYKLDTTASSASLQRTVCAHSGKKLVTTHLQTAIKNRTEIEFKMESKLVI